uniref:Uncharacterized protein n=1 Tax=Onchocerca volvulus TaxID=6282 RepID=A0A8R1XT78_ONCVO
MVVNTPSFALINLNVAVCFVRLFTSFEIFDTCKCIIPTKTTMTRTFSDSYFNHCYTHFSTTTTNSVVLIAPAFAVVAVAVAATETS